jgi:hypothetical protein
MKKEMLWAKSSMEKHHKSRGHLPLRSKISRTELYPQPDVDYAEDELIDQGSSSTDDAEDLNSLALSLEPDKASNSLRRRNIQARSRSRTEQGWNPLTVKARNQRSATTLELEYGPP